MPESITIDGFGPLPVERPGSVAEVCELVRRQRGRGEAIYPVGGRTMLDFGLPPTKPGIALDTTALDQVIDYPARDMTVTVQAGITFAKLQALLAAENQWLPLDVPDPERMTLGGLIACNVSGPRRLGYGTLRDYLLGISFVSDDGVEVKGGGRVVKNVAGYDLMKLHLGALGTMGVLTQVTLKVRPKPEQRLAILIYDVQGSDLARVCEMIRNTQSRPIAVSLVYEVEGSLLIGYEGKTETVKWQKEQLECELNCEPLATTEQPWPEKCWRNAMIYRHHRSFVVMLSMKSSAVPDYVANLGDIPTQADVLNGIVWPQFPEPTTIPSDLKAMIWRAPATWKTPERVFGPPTPAFELMRHIQRTLDPDGVFNPGRMFVT